MYKPLPEELRLGFSEIHDIGLFAKQNIKVGTNFGMTHIQISDTLIRTPLGGFINHSENANCIKQENSSNLYLKTIKDIEEGEEITLKYTIYNL